FPKIRKNRPNCASWVSFRRRLTTSRGMVMHPAVADFIAKCALVAGETEAPADRVTAIAPLMQNLAADAHNFLSPDHFRSEPEHSARNAVHIAPSGNLSLFALV